MLRSLVEAMETDRVKELYLVSDLLTEQLLEISRNKDKLNELSHQDMSELIDQAEAAHKKWLDERNKVALAIFLARTG